ncbi:MAG: ATP-binding cassette domain-containing protein, partial [Clostridia bacterium]|nr:ATP-binding cassette domain-containing protein [Clostridia bacterium]
MESFKIENLSFCYPGRSESVLKNVSFSVAQGEFVVICGKSGCGKTTLLRLLKPSLSPNGDTEGTVYFNGKRLSECDTREQASGIGFVMQNPDNQIVTDKVWHELAFGLESLGLKTPEIRARVSEMASFFGIQSWFYKNVTELSGGQKQLLNLASVMVMQPSVLILDEPTSQLDPIAAGEFLQILSKINRELGTSVILTEHRLEDAFPMADRALVLDEGRVIADDAPKKVAESLKNIKHDMYKALPTPMRVYGEVPNSLSCPLTVREGRAWLEEYSKENTIDPDAIPEDNLQTDGETVIRIKDAWFRYERELPDVVRGFDMCVKKGELFCLLGGNGTGKTTALSLISGLNAPYRGEVLIQGQKISKIKNLYSGLLGVLPQNPQSVFVGNTVYNDLEGFLSESDITNDEKEQRIHNTAILCRIEDLLERHPYDLSGGEQQRAALAKILLTEPEILLLDEPTKGMDAYFKEEFAEILNDLKSDGVAIVMVSHDIEFCAEYADRCALVFDGAITSEGTPREFFKGKSFYTTSANRMARALLPDAVTANDIILACGGKLQKKEKRIKKKSPDSKKIKEFPQKKSFSKLMGTELFEVPMHNKKLTKRTLLSMVLILIFIPLTIYMGISLFGDRKYYFISLLIILETMIPFLSMFESRKPKARELIIISVLCAVAVAGRAAFLMLPQFKPVVAIVIIAGICFGAETGFLVGGVTGFVSNFFFGQGP